MTAQKKTDYVTINEEASYKDVPDNVVKPANCHLDIHRATETANAIHLANTQDELRQAAHNAHIFVSELLQQAVSGDLEREWLLQSIRDLGGDAAMVRKLHIDAKQLHIIVDCLREVRMRRIENRTSNIT